MNRKSARRRRRIRRAPSQPRWPQGCAVSIAACGSSGTKTASVSGESQLIKYANCMRTHGDPDFSDAGQGFSFLTSASDQSPAFKSAEKECARLAPTLRGPQKMSGIQRQAAVKFAECMRSHGASGFPDPVQSTPSPPSAGETVINLRGGMVFMLPAGVSPQSPALERAAAACGVKLHHAQ